MKRIGKALTGAGLTIALVVGGSVAANANTTPNVDYSEFDAAKFGTSISQVQSMFETTGTTISKTATSLSKMYRVVYTNLDEVWIGYTNKNGVWRVTAREAAWVTQPNQALNPMSEAEYLKIKGGMTYAQVRTLVGSGGTRAADIVNKYGTVREYMWPVPDSTTGYGYVQFRIKDGTFVVTRKIYTRS